MAEHISDFFLGFPHSAQTGTTQKRFGSDQQLGKVKWLKKEIKGFIWARLRLAS